MFKAGKKIAIEVISSKMAQFIAQRSLPFLVLLISYGNTSCNSTPMIEKPNLLTAWLKDLAVNKKKLIEKYEWESNQQATSPHYSNLKASSKYFNPDTHPGWFFFEGEQLVLLYIENEEALKNIEIEGIKAKHGEADLILRCSAGKQSVQLVWLEKGIALGTDYEEIFFVEIFPPMDEQSYLNTLYDHPNPFFK